MDRIDFWDLDHTLFSTRELFAPFYDRLAEKLGCTRNEIADSYTLDKIFVALELPPSEWKKQEAWCLAQLTEHGHTYLIANALTVLEERSHVGKQVLITAGRPEWQRAKFAALTPLHRFFAENDRHFINRDGSKGEVIARYSGIMSFVDDSPQWLHDAKAHVPNVHRIRAMWPSEHRLPDPDDGKLWQVATSADELRAAFANCQ